ncbi:hypothetical protein ACI2KR_26105 [Pseudomonas luteola]|uniref:hypothetical protein n=1 Tax=Pseudomonas sp. TaxID=306 RepID=UPI00289E50A6|nr:hypothetical protein [Pseudomonas sp.]
MGLRLTVEQALQINAITADQAKELRAQASAVTRARGRTSGKDASKSVPSYKGKSPQERLFDALKARMPEKDIRYDEPGLIPGRRFKADVYIAPDIIIEMDGYRYHSDRKTFQSDRRRNNLFTLNGFRVFHTYTGQVMNEAALSELVEMITYAAMAPLPEELLMETLRPACTSDDL